MLWLWRSQYWSIWRLGTSTLCCTRDPPLAVIIIGIIVAVAAPQGPIQDPDAITKGTLNSNEETCDEESDSKQIQTLYDKANTANLCESSSVPLQPDYSQHPSQDVRGAVGSLYGTTVPSGTGLLIYPGIKPSSKQHIEHRFVHLNYLWGCSLTCSSFP